MQMAPMAIMAIASTAMQMSAAEKQRRDQRAVLNRQLERDDKATTKAIDLVQQEGQRYDPAARAQGLKEQEQKVFDQTSADVQGAGGANIGAAADAGNVSEDFTKTRAQRAIDEGTRLTSIAREAAKNRSSSMLQGEDALKRADLAGTLQNTFGTNANMGRATGLDAQSVGQPFYGSLGKIAGAIAPNLAGGMSRAGAAANAAASGIQWG